MGYWQNRLIELQDEAWQVRVGQLQTMLSYFGGLCSVSVERADAVTIYVQARRLEGGIEIEAVEQHLPARARPAQRRPGR